MSIENKLTKEDRLAIFKKFFRGSKFFPYDDKKAKAFEKSAKPFINQVFPLLDEGRWWENIGKQFGTIDKFFTHENFCDFVTATKDYINSRDFAGKKRYIVSYDKWGWQKIAPSDELNLVNRLLDASIAWLPKEDRSWGELVSDATRPLFSFVSSAFSDPIHTFVRFSSFLAIGTVGANEVSKFTSASSFVPLGASDKSPDTCPLPPTFSQSMCVATDQPSGYSDNSLQTCPAVQGYKNTSSELSLPVFPPTYHKAALNTSNISSPRFPLNETLEIESKIKLVIAADAFLTLTNKAVADSLTLPKFYDLIAATNNDFQSISIPQYPFPVYFQKIEDTIRSSKVFLKSGKISRDQYAAISNVVVNLLQRHVDAAGSFPFFKNWSLGGGYKFIIQVLQQNTSATITDEDNLPHFDGRAFPMIKAFSDLPEVNNLKGGKVSIGEFLKNPFLKDDGLIPHGHKYLVIPHANQFQRPAFFFTDPMPKEFGWNEHCIWYMPLTRAQLNSSFLQEYLPELLPPLHQVREEQGSTSSVAYYCPSSYPPPSGEYYGNIFEYNLVDFLIKADIALSQLPMHEVIEDDNSTMLAYMLALRFSLDPPTGNFIYRLSWAVEKFFEKHLQKIIYWEEQRVQRNNPQIRLALFPWSLNFSNAFLRKWGETWEDLKEIAREYAFPNLVEYFDYRIKKERWVYTEELAKKIFLGILLGIGAVAFIIGGYYVYSSCCQKPKRRHAPPIPPVGSQAIRHLPRRDVKNLPKYSLVTETKANSVKGRESSASSNDSSRANVAANASVVASYSSSSSASSSGFITNSEAIAVNTRSVLTQQEVAIPAENAVPPKREVRPVVKRVNPRQEAIKSEKDLKKLEKKAAEEKDKKLRQQLEAERKKKYDENEKKAEAE